MVYPHIDKVKNLIVAGSKYGLQRTRALLNALGSPDKELKIIHVAGTNGKGSTVAYISNILLAAGKRAGAFTSPEVYSYKEKFCVDCKPLSLKKIEAYLKAAFVAAEGLEDKPTAFELETAAALYAFCCEGCEYAVVECGLGGRDDSTNAVEKKELAVITSISLEHTAILGDTIEKICAAKSGIIKDCPAVVSALQCEEGRRFFTRLSATFAGDGLETLPSDNSGCSFAYGGEIYKIDLTGREQCYNAATAVTACRLLGIDSGAIKRGLRKTRIKGRLEIIKKQGVTYILDGSHNPASFLPLINYLGGLKGEKTLVFGCLSDKDVNAAAELLCPCFMRAVLFPPESYRAMEISGIENAFRGKIDYKSADTVSGALDIACGDIIAVCGSFTILAEARQWIEKRR